MRPRRARARFLFAGERAESSQPPDAATLFRVEKLGEASERSRVRVLAVSLLLAALVHVLALLSLRWQPQPLPIHESVVTIVHVAPDRDAAPAAPPPAAPPRRPPPARQTASVREPAPPSRPREADAAPPAPSAPTAPAASEAREASLGTTSAPLAPAPVAAQPRYKSNPEPEYPVAARRRRQTGIVLLSVRVDILGRPESVAIHTSSGFAALDEAAIAAVKQWEFEPGRLAGVPVASQVEVPIRFELDRD